ncbi:hypothetical protein fugu_012144 [Takifugu bimaculatus]|uniref:Protein-tyrosine-phosphatase n=1 Tax=Takifugu bimaculatus TaxID=433685 RepID=A0A4Z2C9N4_9TELE|nr:hypothetical protein fugu_012144 [Takifugu bimaculatus]
MLRHNNLLMLWTGLSDQQKEGQPLWTDGSVHNLTDNVMSLLPANQTDCFALQRNATGPGYFLTPFFCNIALPFICQYQVPLLPPSFSFDLVQVAEQQVELCWSDLLALISLNISSFEVFLQYREETNGELFRGERIEGRLAYRTESRSVAKKVVEVPISLSSRGVTVAGLSPGSVYSFTLRAAHPDGSSWTLGQTQTAYTRYLRPIRCAHTLLRLAGWSLTGSTGIEVSTVTKHGIESCEQAAVVVQTELRAPGGLVGSSTRGNLTFCWTTPLDDPPDGYDITSRPPIYSAPTTLRINQSSPRIRWVNESTCVDLGRFTPGQTYELGVILLKGNDRSKPTSIAHTTDPLPIQVAVPLSVGTNSAQLHVQRPQLSVIDGVKVCMCPVACDKVCKGSCGYLCDWYPLPAGVNVLTLQNLSPGSEYQLGVYSTSHQQTGPPYYTTRIKTGLAPPNQVREGVVTDSSIELLWDPAQGDSHGYEVMCLNCEQPHRVQKVSSQNAVFSSLIPGTRFHFVLRTEKESFTDSYPVTINITAVPEVPQEVVLSGQVVTSVFVTWRPPPGGVKGYKIVFGLLSADRRLWVEQLVQGTSYEITDLIPGSDYCVSVQSVLGLDASRAIHREFSTQPSGLCPLRLADVTSSSFSVSWDSAYGEFDFHRVTVTNTSVTNTLVIPKKERVAVVTGLVEGCTYNVSVERVRGGTAGSAASLRFSTVPASVQGMHILNVSARAFSLRWEQAKGCVDHYWVNLQPNKGKVIVHPAHDGYIQADVVNVSPGTQYAVTVGAASASSSNISPGVIPGAPSALEGEAVGSNGILLSWTMPPDSNNVDGYVIRYKEVCPYPDSTFTEVTKYLDIPETLLTDFTPGSTYHIEVAAISSAGVGAFSKSLYIKTAESAPGLVTNLTAFAQNHSFVVVTWFLPRRINGLITKFAVKAKHARTGQTVRTLEVNAEDIMTVALPHCNDAADILSKATLSPLEITASSPPITLSAVPSAASWSVPISVGVDQLRPYTAYLFEVSAFTSDGEGQIASTMVRMPESAPEDPPQNFEILNMTSRLISVSWSSPNIITGKFSYMLYLYGPTGYLYENSTGDMQFTFAGLTPYTRYTLEVRAKAAGEVGPSVQAEVITPAEAPSVVQDLQAEAEDSVSIRVSWRSPAKPNGLITRYRLQVLVDDVLLQDITLTADVNTTSLNEDEMIPAGVHNRLGGVTVREEVLDVLAETLSYLVSELNPFTEYTFRVTASTVVGEGPAKDITEKTREQVPSSVLDVSYQNISSTSILVAWVPPLYPNGRITHYTVYGLNLKSNQALKWMTNSTSILITDLDKYTGYKLRVAASTAVGESSLSEEDDIFVFTLEDEPDSPPEDLTVEDISPFTATLSWSPPEKANGVIQHYEVLYENESFSAMANTSSNRITLTNLRPFSYYNVSVRVFTRYGHGNQTSDTLYLLSGEGVPGSPPYDLKFESVSPSEVNVTWEPPLFPNGIISHYSLELWNSSHYLNLTSQTNYIHITHLRKYAHYRVAVQAHTRVGPGNYSSEPLNITTLEDEPFDPPQNVTIANATASSITLFWHPPAEPNGIIIHYTVYYSDNNSVTGQRVPVTELANLSSPDSTYTHTVSGLIGGTNYTVWMTSSTAQGDGGVQSEPQTVFLPEYVPNDSVRNLTAQIFSSTAIIVSWDPPLEPNGRPYYLLTLQEAGIPPDVSNQGAPVVNKTTKHTTTDTVFLFTKLRKFFPYVLTVTPATGAGPANNHTRIMYLRTDDDIPSSAPLLVSTRNLSSSSIEVVWQRPLEANGEIIEFLLTLFGPGGSNTSHTSTTSSILTNLHPYTAYNLSITAATRKGSGPYLLLQLHTDEGVPMSPPRNLTIYNHSAVSVWLSWEPPLEPNGVVIQYGFRIQDLITHTVTHRNSSGPSTMEYLSGFRPHSSYEISVYSYTRVGHGSQFSSPVTFTTSESVSDAVGNLTCSGVSWDSIQLSWDLPDHPNGQIRFYEVQLEVEGQSYVHSTDTAEYTVSGLSPDQEYSLTVAAVNSAGPGDLANCTASTLSESVPAAPRSLAITHTTANSVTLHWAPPLYIPGVLKEFHVVAQLLSTVCEPSGNATAHLAQEEKLSPDCVDLEVTSSLNASDGANANRTVTVQSLAKYRYYRFKVAAVTNAGVGEYTHWTYVRTLAGSPDAPPRGLNVTASSSGFRIAWEAPAILSGPTSYLSTEPKDPPKNVVISIIPEEVTRVKVTFTPPDEPNGNITAYFVYIFERDKLVKNVSLNITEREQNTMTAVIEGLKGGHNYSIQISAKNGAGRSPPSPHVQIMTDIKAPAKPTQRPQAVLSHGGVAMVTHRSITIRMPACFYSDDNGPIKKIQVIVAESGVKDIQNVTNWRSAYFDHPAPYLTDKGFPNPPCSSGDRSLRIRGALGVSGDKQSVVRSNHYAAGTYVIGENDDCVKENSSNHLCNGPLKPNTVYVFKFRATNIRGQSTDSDFSEHIKTAVDGLLTREEQIILGVLLSFFLAVLLIIIICGSVKIHQRKKEGGTYSPREAEIIETKCKLDQLIAVADLELKQEKINRLLSYRKSLKPINKKTFLQHVEDLCANDNAKFQEEFGELPKLLQDLGTTDADLPWNKSKNRFPNIKPYNNNRVKLLSEPGSAGSDYINASFVSIRCHKYWPEDNKPIAGVGRTGVFIALDHLIQHIRDHDFVDIYGLVAELRSERMCMVQNLAQYIFLHQSTLELLNNKGNSQSIWFVSYSALEKMDSLDAMEGDVELEWEETTM